MEILPADLIELKSVILYFADKNISLLEKKKRTKDESRQLNELWKQFGQQLAPNEGKTAVDSLKKIYNRMKVNAKKCHTMYLKNPEVYPMSSCDLKLIKLYTLILCVIITVYITVTETKSQNTVKNHDLLAKIGFSRVRAPNSHHRKRLAVESRHHSRSDDSHMFVIKLPPNQHYYVHNKPNTYIEPDKKVPVGFKSNGKPGKIYHWNIPVIKKIVQAKSKSRLNDDSNLIDIKYTNWNEVLDKPTNSRQSYKKPSYYVPSKLKKSSFFKYFPGNGKPQSFYVIEKNKKKHHHRLLH